MDGRKMTGVGVGGVGSGVLLFFSCGLWGLAAAVTVLVALAVLTHLPELAQVLEVVYRHRDGHWLLDEDARTNRRIALHNHVPLPERGQAQQVAPQPELGAPDTAQRPRPRPDP